MSKKKEIPRLQFITGSNLKLSHAEEAKQACKGGINFIQFREKNATVESCKRMAETTLEVCKMYGATLIIDDHIEVAKEIQADGVHLGYNDDSPQKARRILGEDAIIGGTGNTFDDVRKLANANIDYIGMGPYRFTHSKEDLKPYLNLEDYQIIKRQMDESGISIPVFAVGGIQVDDVDELLKTGIHGVAVSSAIGKYKNPMEAAEEFVNTLREKSSA